MTDTKDKLERLFDLSTEKMELTRRAMLGELTERERAVLEMRFGIADLGEHWAEMREKIRAIEERALEKLKSRK